MEKKEKKRSPREALTSIAPVALGAVLGWFLGRRLVWLTDTGAFGVEGLWGTVLLLVFLALACYIQIAVHEAGHLLFGLLTGYRFVSYRVGGLMLVRTAQGLKLRRMRLAGTAGQCLLRPPALRDGKLPCFLYNMGGALMNLVFSAVCLAPAIACGGPWRMFFTELSAFGFLFALCNGIPLRMGGLDNDGKNALSLNKHPAALRGFWLQMEINARQCLGQRLRDMPEEFFTRPEEKDMDNPLVSSLGVFAANRLMDQGDYPRAAAEMEALLKAESLPGIYRGLLLCDCAVCALMAGDPEKAKTFVESKEQRRFMKRMKDYISVIRTEYALARLAKGDEALAAETLARFEKAAKRHPAEADVASERELLAAIDRACERKTETVNGI